jgi:hypothetical protein
VWLSDSCLWLSDSCLWNQHVNIWYRAVTGTVATFPWVPSSCQHCYHLPLSTVQLQALLLPSLEYRAVTGTVATFPWVPCSYQYCCYLPLSTVQLPALLLPSLEYRAVTSTVVPFCSYLSLTVQPHLCFWISELLTFELWTNIKRITLLLVTEFVTSVPRCKKGNRVSKQHDVTRC